MVKKKIIKQMESLSKAKVNDAVKLAYLQEEQVDLIDGLDLTALTEFKRSNNGVVEVKFMDRLKVLEELLDLTEKADPVEAMLDVIGGGDR